MSATPSSDGTKPVNLTAATAGFNPGTAWLNVTDLDVPANRLTFSLEPGAPAGAAVNATNGYFHWMQVTMSSLEQIISPSALPASTVFFRVYELP